MFESDADHGRERDQRQNEVRIPLGRRRPARRPPPSARRSSAASDGQTRGIAYTLFVAARPNRPFGASASATMTIANTTICV